MKKQKTLTLKVGEKNIASNPFDFEAMCLVNDEQFKGRGSIACGRSAIPYMFQGTAVTDAVLDTLSIEVITKMSLEVWGFYLDALASVNKKKSKNA